jgi:nicotinamide riboside kinase
LFKVALVGTHGVGKTTVAYELGGAIKRRGCTVELLTEIARECPFALNDQASREAHQWIIARQIQLEIEKLPRAEVLICDRSVMDNFAYYTRLYGSTDEMSSALLAYCRAWTNTYDLLVRLPIVAPLTADGFRSTDTRFQHEIEALCDQLFESHYNEQTHPAYIRNLLTANEIADYVMVQCEARTSRGAIEAASGVVGNR